MTALKDRVSNNQESTVNTQRVLVVDDENSISESSAVDETGRVDALSPDDEPEISVISYEEKN